MSGSSRSPDAVDVSAASKLAEEKHSRFVLAGAATMTLGLALVGTSHPDVGGPVVVASWLMMAAAIHRYGRNVS